MSKEERRVVNAAMRWYRAQEKTSFVEAYEEMRLHKACAALSRKKRKART